MGPHQAYGNIPRSIEFAVDWVSNCIEFLRSKGIRRIEPKEKGVQEWTKHVHEIAEGFLSNEIVRAPSDYDWLRYANDVNIGLLDDWRQQKRCRQAKENRGKV